MPEVLPACCVYCSEAMKADGPSRTFGFSLENGNNNAYLFLLQDDNVDIKNFIKIFFQFVVCK